MTNNNFSSTAAFLWSVADLLRGDFKQSQYGRIILPFTLLRRLECVLEATKPDVLTKYEAVKAMPIEAQDKLLTHAAQLSFYNTSKMDLNRLGETGVASNLESYIQSFSPNAREIFEH
ncbi:type I restriction-modification system subunit M N-terminal domain-containing protein, partial [Vibrio alginolyticus]